MVKLLSTCVTFILILSLTTAEYFSNESRQHNILQQNANYNYKKVLKFWEEHKNDFIFHGRHKDVVLVMGNTGSGKTTLASALTGRKLRVTKSYGYLIIVDDEEDRIGTGATSKTLIPEVMTDNKRNVTYVDCSGFHDNRNVEYEISSLYFQNILLDQVERLKIIFVINYNSLKVNGNKNDFDDLFEHIGEFIKDIPKFLQGISLVVTKVENTYEVTRDGKVFLSNDNVSVLNGIAEYLKLKKANYLNKTENVEKYRMFVKLIDSLLQRNNNLHTRIALFRQPTGLGLLDKLPTSMAEINTIANMIIEELDYVQKQKNDFGFPLSKSAKITIDQIIDDIYRNALTNRLETMNKEVFTHYLQLEKQYNDIELVLERVSQAENLIADMENVDEPKQLFEVYLNAMNNLNVSVSLNNLKLISDDIKTLSFFTTISNIKQDMYMLLLKNKTQNIIDWMRNLRNIYAFLNSIQENLSEYNSQKLKNDSRIQEILMSCKNLVDWKVIQDIIQLESVVKEISNDKLYQKIKTLKLNQIQLKKLRYIFSAFARKLEFSCESHQMTVKGYNVRMKDVIESNNCWSQAKIVQIFALNKIFIDTNIDKTGEELQLFILAPTWEIVGEPKIILNGKAGEAYKQKKAKTAFSNSYNGMNGESGLPGGPAGIFFGFGRHFIDSENLEVHANGGNGGQGQHGGDGANGIAGQELSESPIKRNPNIGDIETYLAQHNFQYTKETSKFHQNLGLQRIASGTVYDMDVSGKPAIKPTDGGDGGSGGQGGYPGKIVINGLGNSVTFKAFNESGSTGLEGQGGRGGRGTSNGRRVKFTVTLSYQFSNFFGSYDVDNFEWIDGSNIPAGKNGEPGTNNINEKSPTSIPMASLYPVINSFKAFIRMNLFDNIRQWELTNLMNQLENDNEIKEQYNTLAFVKELEILENQYLEFKSKMDFTPFYKSFLSRIEEFAKKEKLLGNKKVLNYLYTAALTKLFTLKKKHEGKTVVDLTIYLNTIERTVKDLRHAQNLQTVINYRNDNENILRNKIREANDFIENKIVPEINKLWDDSDNQFNAIIEEIKANKNATEDALTRLENNRAKIRDMMYLQSMLSSLKLAASSLSLGGPIGASVGMALTSLTSISEGMLIDSTTSIGPEQNRVNSVDPNLKLLARVKEVFNIKPQQLAVKLAEVVKKLDEHKEELSISQKENMEISQKITSLKTKIDEIKNRKANSISDIERRNKDAKRIEKELNKFINSRKIVMEEEKTRLNAIEIENTNAEKLKKEMRIEKSLRRINDIKTILNSVEIVFNVVRKLKNDDEIVRNINLQISEYVDQLKDLEKLENQVYDIIIPDLRQIETTIDTIINTSINGSSHVKLDLTKWTIKTSLNDVKSLLQKFTRKMSFDIQSNLKRYIEKIDEGFSILIDIYDRIDTYTDSVRQAEYMAQIFSTPMTNIQVRDTELSSALTDLKLSIQSNVLFEKYAIALHAFKQHYFPFAAHVLMKFQLPSSSGMMQLNKNIELLRSNIVDKIKEMKNHIDESESTLGEYSKLTHDNNLFNSNTTGASPFYVWKYDAIKDELERLLNGSEIVIKADISNGLNYNSVKFNDIGINFKVKNEKLQNNLTSILKNFTLTMSMIGNNYYRCGEQYYSISFDDDLTISYILSQDEAKNWINPNAVYSTIRKSHAFLSPYALWSIQLKIADKSASFDDFNNFSNETIDLQLIGRGHYIEQDSDFNFNICNGYLDAFYNVENIAKELV